MDARAILTARAHRYGCAMSTKPDATPSRKRDAEATKATILDAAFQTFTERGFARATLREIAARAGVSHGLLRRHFGSKEALFLKALPGTRDWAAQVAPGGHASFAQRTAAMLIDRDEAGSDSDVLVALLRLGAENTADTSRRLYAEVLRSSLELYEPIVGGEAPELRSEVILSLLLGLTFTRHVLKGGTLAKLDDARYRTVVENALQRLVREEPDAEAGG